MNKVREYFKGDELAAQVWLDKYCLRDENDNLLEESPEDMHNRIADEFSRIESSYSNPISRGEIFNLLKDFKYLVPGGSPMAGVGNRHLLSSLSNCFVIHNDYDHYGSIFITDEEQVQIMKRRGGVGHDLSMLRPAGASTTNSAKSATGVVSFMRRYSNSTNEVAQVGRRGALMLSLSIEHPDAENFIKAKQDRTSIVYANVSLRITNEFMAAVMNDDDFYQTFPVGLPSKSMVEEFGLEELPYDKLIEGKSRNTFIRRVRAKRIWEMIIHGAWAHAEPGVLFWDRILNESPARGYGEEWKEKSTNPCFHGDTIVAVADGRNGVKIKDLVGTNFPVYSACANETEEGKILGWRCEVKNATAIESGIKPVVEIHLSDGSSFVCTEDHQLARSDGKTYVEAKDSVGVSLGKIDFGINFNGTRSIITDSINPKSVISVEHLEGSVPVYDLKVEDNHNFYIITKQDDDRFLNSSGVLVHNCGELPLPEYDSCRLMALNLYSYVENPFEKSARFNFELFKDHIWKSQRMMDNLIDLEIEKIEGVLKKIESDPEPDFNKEVEYNLWSNVLEKAKRGRRTGLGVTAEGDMLAAMGIRYGSDESIKFSEEVHKFLAIHSYSSSIVLAKERGSFDGWNFDDDFKSDFIQRIYGEMPTDIQNLWRKYGRRSIGNLTIAPTGSVSIMAQTTSGVEPAFSIYYKRRRKISPSAERFDYQDEVGDKWLEYNVFHHKFIEWFEKNWYKVDDRWFDLGYKPYLEDLSDEMIDKIIQKSPYNRSTSNDIDWIRKVKMQGAIQKWVDHSISVTVNVPKETDEKTVNLIYLTSWENGCKGCTIYRDGSRSGVLIKEETPTFKFDYQDSAKRPETLPCKIHRLTALKQRWMVLVGLHDDKPYEIFTMKDVDNQFFPNRIEEGFIRKVKKRTYSLTGVYGGKEYKIDNIRDYMTDDEAVDTRKYSLMLRSRIHPIHIVEQIDKYATITSFDKAISRVLKLYLNGQSSKDKCEECGSDLQFVEGCLTCKNCGYSKCG